MRRTRFWLLGAAIAVALTVSTPVHAATAASPDARPNVVVIMTDDQDVASLSVMPNVRRLLAERGTTFDNSFVSYPLCCPSRATYLTGQLPHNHGVVGNAPPDGGYYKLKGDETLPVWLSRAGYRTAHIGKYLNLYGLLNPWEVPPGWQEWYGSIDPTTYQMWGYVLNENGHLKKYGDNNVEDPALYQTDVYAQKSVDYINRKAPGDAPFFLSVAPLAAHTEAKPSGGRDPRPAPRHRGAFEDAALPQPPSFNEADVSDKPAHIRQQPPLDDATVDEITTTYRSRLESLLAVDEAVAAIVEALTAQGELDNTLIIFTSDNGWFQGEHRIAKGKTHAYEESIRVPLVLSGPGVAAGAHSSAMVTNADLAPTILDVADASAGLAVDGRSLLAPTGPGDRALLVETGPKVSGQQWYAAIRTTGMLYVEHSTGERELYDLTVDPFQLDSRHDDPRYQHQIPVLADQLHHLQGCDGASCR